MRMWMEADADGCGYMWMCVDLYTCMYMSIYDVVVCVAVSLSLRFAEIGLSFRLRRNKSVTGMEWSRVKS